MQLRSLILWAVAVASLFSARVGYCLTAPVLARTSGRQSVQVVPGKSAAEPNICGIVGGASCWFCYVPPKSGALFLDTQGSTFDTLLGVFVDDGSNRGYASLIPVVCDDNSGKDGVCSSLCADVTNGVTYYIMIDGKQGAHGQAVLNYSFDGCPYVSFIPNQAISEEQRTMAIPFTIGDSETEPGSLRLSGQSSDPNLVSSNGIVFGGSGAYRTVTVSPTPSANGTAVISVSVSDGAGNASSTSFTLSVAKVNHNPVARDVRFVRLPGRSISISLAALTRTASDPDNDAASVISVSPCVNRSSTVTKSAAFVTYTAPANYNVEDKFTYTISDGKGGSATATVIITVSPTAGQTVVY